DRRVRYADRCVGLSAQRQQVQWTAGAPQPALEPARRVRVDGDGEAAYLRARPRVGGVRPVCRGEHPPRGPRRPPPMVGADPGNRQEHAVPDEDTVMIVVKKAISRRAVLRGVGATIALPLLDAMVPALTAMKKTAANPVRRYGAFYVPNGFSVGEGH